MSISRALVRDLVRLGWPVLIAQLAVMANSVIDTIMAGRYGTLDLAAVGIGASIYFSVFVALMGVLLALTPIVAQMYGAGRHADIGEELRQSAWLAAALTLVSLALFAHPEPFLAVARLAARAGSQGARLFARARLGGAGIAAVPRVLQLLHRDLAPAHGDGADAGRPRAQGAAQLGVHVRQSGRARAGQYRLRGGDCAHLLDPVRACLDLVLVRARLPALSGVRALVLAGRESAWAASCRWACRSV